MYDLLIDTRRERVNNKCDFHETFLSHHRILATIATLLTQSMDTSIESDSGSSINSTVSRTTLLSGQPTSVETYSSPFAALTGGLSLG